MHNAVSYGNFAEIYDSLMDNVDYDAWSEYIVSLIRTAMPNAHTILDCACGTGSVTVRLKKDGYSVTGLDISQSMLNVAAQKARENGLIIPFVCMDMRKLSLHKPCDVINCACDGVNYLTSTESLCDYFTAAHKTLNAGGILLFDISSRHKLRDIIGANTFAYDDGKKTAYIWQNVYDDENKLIEMNLSFFVRKGECYDRFTETHVQRAHSKTEIVNALHKSGFEDIRAYEAFTTDADNDMTERIQFVAVRAD